MGLRIKKLKKTKSLNKYIIYGLFVSHTSANVPFVTYLTQIRFIALPYQLRILFQKFLSFVLRVVCHLLFPMSFALTSPMTRRGLKTFQRLF